MVKLLIFLGLSWGLYLPTVSAQCLSKEYDEFSKTEIRQTKPMTIGLTRMQFFKKDAAFYIRIVFSDSKKCDVSPNNKLYFLLTNGETIACLATDTFFSTLSPPDNVVPNITSYNNMAVYRCSTTDLQKLATWKTHKLRIEYTTIEYSDRKISRKSQKKLSQMSICIQE